MSKKISLIGMKPVSIYLGKSIPAEELYFTCEDKKTANEIDLTVIDPYGEKDSGIILFAERNNRSPRPIGLKPKSVGRFRFLKLSAKKESVEMEMKFFRSHGPGRFEPIQFSIVEWE